jgi:hypothetical protein
MLFAVTVSTPFSPSTTVGCQANILTPVGNATSPTTDTVPVCSNNWRSWTPAGFVGVDAPAGGLVGGNLVIAGGRSSISAPITAAQVTNRVQIIPLPTCATPQPAATAGPVMPTAVYGAASAVVGGKLFVIGGSHDASALVLGGAQLCLQNVQVFDGTSWSAGPSLPLLTGSTGATAGLCHGTAVALGSTIVLTGGSLRPMPARNVINNKDNEFLANETTCVLDTAAMAPAWVCFTGVGQVDPGLNRMGQAGATDHTGVRSIIIAGTTQATNNGHPIAPGIKDSSQATVAGGVPAFVTLGATLPSALVFGAAADNPDDGQVYFLGGTAAGKPNGNSVGTTGLFATPDSLATPPIAWTTKLSAPHARTNHLFIAAKESTDAGAATHIYAVGGHDAPGATVPLTVVDEFMP